MTDVASHPVASQLVAELTSRGLTLASCESLTGGLLGATVTSVPGASAVYRGGLITYASDLKVSLAGLDPNWIEEFGVVNETTAVALAVAARSRCGSSIGIGCTGVAGPDQQDGQEVGTVWVAIAIDRPGAEDPVLTRKLALTGERAEIRQQAVAQVLQWLLDIVSPVA